MKEKINIIIEEIIKLTLSEVDQKYVIINNNRNLKDNRIIYEGWAGRFTESEAGASALEYLASATLVSLGGTFISTLAPTNFIGKALSAGLDAWAGMLYLLASKELFALSYAAETDAQSNYYTVTAAVYFACGIMLLIGGSLRVVSSFRPNVNSITNATVTGHAVAAKTARLIQRTDLKPEDFLEILNKNAPDNVKGKNMSIFITKKGKLFTCYDNKIIFYTDNEGVQYFIMQGDEALQAFNRVGPPDPDNLPVINVKALSEFDSNELKAMDFSSMGELPNSGYSFFPIDGIRLETTNSANYDAIVTNGIIENSKKSISRADLEIEQMRADLVDDEINKEMLEISQDLENLTTTFDSMTSSLSSADATLVQQRLNEALEQGSSGTYGANAVLLDRDQIQAGINVTELQEARRELKTETNNIKSKVDNLQESKEKGTASQLSSSSGKSKSSKSADSTPGRSKGEYVMDVISVRRIQLIDDILERFKVDSRTMNNKLKANPITVPYKLKDKKGDLVYDAEIQFFAYQPPGVYIGRITHRQQIDNLTRSLSILRGEIAELDNKITREYASISDFYKHNEDGTITLLGPTDKKKLTTPDQENKYKSIPLDIADYNSKTKRKAQMEKELDARRSLDKKQEGPGSTVYPVHRKKLKKLDEHFNTNASKQHKEDCKQMDSYLVSTKETWGNTLWGIASITNFTSRAKMLPTILNGLSLSVLSTTELGAIAIWGTNTSNADESSDKNTPLDVVPDRPSTLDDLLSEIEVKEKIKEAEDQLNQRNGSNDDQ